MDRSRCAGCRRTVCQCLACRSRTGRFRASGNLRLSFGKASICDAKYAVGAPFNQIETLAGIRTVRLRAFGASARQTSLVTELVVSNVGREAADLDEARPKGERSLAGRQGFEPRYHGPEAAEETSVGLGFVGFVRQFASQLSAVSGGDGTFAGDSFKILSSHVRLIHKTQSTIAIAVNLSFRLARPCLASSVLLRPAINR